MLLSDLFFRNGELTFFLRYFPLYYKIFAFEVCPTRMMAEEHMVTYLICKLGRPPIWGRTGYLPPCLQDQLQQGPASHYVEQVMPVSELVDSISRGFTAAILAR